MKRFFDLSLLILIPFLFVGQFNTDSTPSTNPLEISERAKEIHTLVSTQINMSLEEIQEALDSVEENIAEGRCTLSCNPQNCCYHQGHLDRFIYQFGCCIADGTCPYPCLDLNGDGCVTGADFSILLGNWCPS